MMGFRSRDAFAKARPDLADVYRWVEEFFGSRIEGMYFDSGELVVVGILYETFVLQCNLDGRYRFIGVGIMLGTHAGTSTFFGRKPPWTSDRESFRAVLATVDRWCRAHLSPEFLAEYEANLAAESR